MKFEALLELALEAGVTVTVLDDGVVQLAYDDGSLANLYWHTNTGRWVFYEPFDTCPCDVVARDSP